MSETVGETVQLLVIEDEDDIRNLVVMHLKRAGFDVLSAGNGSDGLSLLRAHRPPVLLLDLMLPDMTGHEICAMLRADPETKDTYVIMVTALSEEDDRIAGFQVGADDYVPKPFSVKELVLRVQAAARRATSAPKLPDLPETLDSTRLQSSVDSLLRSYPEQEGVLYLKIFQQQTEGGWPELQAIIDTDPRFTSTVEAID